MGLSHVLHHSVYALLIADTLITAYQLPSRQQHFYQPSGSRFALPQSLPKRGSWCFTREGAWGRCDWFVECPFDPLESWAPAPTLCSALSAVPLICCPLNRLRNSSSYFPKNSWSPDYRKPTAVSSTPAPSTPATSTPVPSTPVPSTAVPSMTSTESSQRGEPDGLFCGRTPGAPQSAHDSVVGGTVVVPHSRPWMAAVGMRGCTGCDPEWVCGGVLISRTTVLTAAHCVKRGRATVVRVGVHNTSAPGQDRDVSIATIHPGYKHPAMEHDLALLYLTHPLDINERVLPVCLPTLPPPTSELSGSLRSTRWIGLAMKVAGWGSFEYNGRMSPVLREVGVKVQPLSLCRSAYRKLPNYKRSFPRGLTESFICAGDENGGKDACKGDSGGPLIYEGNHRRGAVLAGVVAGGHGCGLTGYPGLYTNALAHLEWIQETSRQLDQYKSANHSGKSGR